MATKKAELVDPYASLTKKDKTVTSLTVSDIDRAFIFSICPQQSILQTTVNRLFAEFVKSMRRAGYKHYDPTGYVNAVNNVKIIVEKHEKKREDDNKPTPSALSI